MEAVFGLVGVALGAGISWAVSAADRKHQQRQARRAEKRASYQAYLTLLRRLQGFGSFGPGTLDTLLDQLDEAFASIGLDAEEDVAEAVAGFEKAVVNLPSTAEPQDFIAAAIDWYEPTRQAMRRDLDRF
jgi:hypothetical protein